MANYTDHKLIFPAIMLPVIKDRFFTGKCLDFDRIITSPIQMYLGDISSEDAEDFPCNWHSWRYENWGTKWNANNSSLRKEEDKAILRFSTANGLARPISVAIANILKIPFEHRYFSETEDCWGIEIWSLDKTGFGIYRALARKQKQEDFETLKEEFSNLDW